MTWLKLFKRSLFLWGGLLTLLAALMLAHFFLVTPSDYTKVALTTTPGGKTRPEQVVEQRSEGVKKELWIPSAGKIDHHTIESRSSKLLFTPQGNHYEVSEKLHRLRGIMDGEKERHFSAAMGNYHYGSHAFFADNVSLKIKEHGALLLQGKATGMVARLTDRAPLAHVEKLVADIPSSRGKAMIESDSASFDGDEVTLKGKVFLNHPLGKIWAQGARLTNYDENRETLFSQASLTGKVKIEMAKGTSLRCAEGVLDVESGRGEVRGGEGEVYLTDTLGEQTIVGMSKTVSFVAKEEGVEEVTALGHVAFHVGDAAFLTCDEATYRSLERPQISAKGEVCHLEREGERLEGKTISLDLEKNTLSMTEATGHVTGKGIPLQFSANEAVWKDDTLTATLSGDVWVLTEEGHLLCNGRLLIEQEVSCGKREVHRIWTEGETTLHTPHLTLKAPTTLHLNRETRRVAAYATETTPLELSIGKIVATGEEAHLEYTESDEGVSIKSARASGDIILKNGDPTAPLKRARGDLLTFDATKEVIVLSSSHLEKVVYYDEEEGIEMAATEIHIGRASGDKPLVSGVGKVRLSLTDEEKAWFSPQKI